MPISEIDRSISADTVLVVDDEESVLESLEFLLEKDFRVLKAQSGEKALALIRENNVQVVILDVMMPGMGGMAALNCIMSFPDHPEVIILSAADSARMGVQAVKNGAFDYIAKPFDTEEFLEVTRKALEKKRMRREIDFLRSEVFKLGGFGNIVGRSKPMEKVLKIISRVCQTDSNILITGESGTGKELVARTIHSRGIRSKGPFISVNCAAIPRELLESEFFGHERGAFTGAHEKRIGKFEFAHGGILFLDELSTLHIDLQAKLLRVLQEKEFTRVGGDRNILADAQVISATNQDLKELIRKGKFREDLYFRLNVLPIELPPLRERPQDIPALVHFILEKITHRLNRPPVEITQDALELLKRYHWPGNIRELENLLERLVAFSSGEGAIDVPDLPNELIFPEVESHIPGSSNPSRGLNHARDQFERMYILSVLRKVGWNQTEAAKVLGVHRNTLIRKLSLLGLGGRKI